MPVVVVGWLEKVDRNVREIGVGVVIDFRASTSMWIWFEGKRPVSFADGPTAVCSGQTSVGMSAVSRTPCAITANKTNTFFCQGYRSCS